MIPNKNVNQLCELLTTNIIGPKANPEAATVAYIPTMRPRFFGNATWLIQYSLVIKIVLIVIPRINLNGNQKIKSLITARKKNINAVMKKHATVKNHEPYLCASFGTNGADKTIPSGVIEVLRPIILALNPISSIIRVSSGYESPIATQKIPTQAIAANTPLFIIQMY